ncbi:hypothetical protein lerEdw1_002504 [Lerista edwardsae]|nr:hypothetical protein lerEdw1_002504 [Lerista edwardsae]
MFLPDYLFLSNCETGKRSHVSSNNKAGSILEWAFALARMLDCAHLICEEARCHSWSNSDRSLEQASSDDVFVDFMVSQHSLHVQPSGSLLQELAQPVTQRVVLPRNSDTSGPPSSDFSSSSPLSGPPSTPTFLLGKSQSALPHGMTDLDVLASAPPPRPPKPTSFSDRRAEERLSGGLQNGHATVSGAQGALVPRRISISGLDSMRSWKGIMTSTSAQRSKAVRLCQAEQESEDRSRAGSARSTPARRTALRAATCPCTPVPPPPASGPDSTADGYIPMSPGSATFALSAASTEKLSSPLPELPTDVEPPPVNRDLKPRRKARPPPLDLRNLSTIREHAALTRTWTVPYNRTSFISPERDGINSARAFASSVSGDEEESYIQMKPFLSEEQRVDYVQVDEQRTQALQNTKQEWRDERQSKLSGRNTTEIVASLVGCGRKQFVKLVLGFVANDLSCSGVLCSRSLRSFLE